MQTTLEQTEITCIELMTINNETPSAMQQLDMKNRYSHICTTLQKQSQNTNAHNTERGFESTRRTSVTLFL